MTTHDPKITVLVKPIRSVIECSCGGFKETESGSGSDVDKRLLLLHRQHAKDQE